MVGNISNHYGGLDIKQEKGKYYWGIEDYTNIDWEEIPEYLYKSLVKFEKSLLEKLEEDDT